jgi:chloramphenicol-sensitive protein RarD
MTSASETSRAGPGERSEDRPSSPGALWAGFGCYALWAGLSLLFMALARYGVGPWDILAYRCIWSLPWAGAIALMAGQGRAAISALANPRTLSWLTASTLLVSGNWALFIWASVNGHKLDASLAYYINPLLNMAAGAVLFRERFTRVGALAVALAAIGVALQGLAVGHPPWLALSLALSFWGYGVVRKRMSVEAQAGLFAECLLLAPLGLAYLVFTALSGGHPWGRDGTALVLIPALGPATVVPLALFAYAARRVRLSTMGFFQFLVPTGLFVIAMVTGEPLAPLEALSFAFIWSAVVVFVLDAWRRAQEAKR